MGGVTYGEQPVMNSRPPNSQRQAPMPSGRGSTPLSQLVQSRMAAEEIWNIRSANDLWICPFCLSAIAKRPGSTATDSVVRHLENCRHFALGKGHPQARQLILDRRSYENIIYSAQSDPAWKVYDSDGVWLSPFSLQRVPAVRTTNGKVDNFLFQALSKHLTNCPFFRQGMPHTVDEVMLARELHRRIPEVVRFTRHQMHSQAAWRWVDASGAWICPYTLFAVAQVRLTSLPEWAAAAESIALHLITHSPRFATGQSIPHPDASIAHAAGPGGRNVPSPERTAPTPVTPSQILGNTTRTGLAILTPTPTASRTVSGGNPILASRGNHNHPSPIPSSMDMATQPPLVSGNTGAFLFSRTPLPGAFENTPAARRLTPLPRLQTPLPGNPTLERRGFPLPIATPLPVAAPDHALNHHEERDGHLDWMDETDSGPVAQLADSGPRTDMIHARKLQEKFLQRAPDVPGFQIASRFEACTDITGDFFVFIPLPDGCIGFAIGDVSGHGVQAGLIMSMAKKTLEIYAAQALGPADTLARVNDALVSDLGGKMFISMCYAVMDPNEGTITWARAGHNPALRYNLVTLNASEIKPKGMVVGMKSGAIFRQSLEEEVTSIDPGDVFLLYTDGITETMNLQHEEFGPERLAEIVKQFAGDGPDVLVDQIMDRIRHFRGPRPPSDDATMVAMLVE